jgi:hypothetical protein
MPIRSLLYFVFFLLVLSCCASAQTATEINPLTFGNVFPGIPKAITKKDAGAAAEYHISGTAGAEVIVDFTLPEYMNAGGFNMQMIFSETNCALDTTASPDQSNPSQDNIDPWHTITYRLGSGGMTIWLGGTVVPRLVQPTGSYSAQIVLRVEYTGN